jgi:hypothetical protein
LAGCNCHHGSDEQIFGADQQVRGRGPSDYGAYSLTRRSQRCLSLSLSKKAHVCPKKQQLTPGPSRGAIFDCDKPDFILKNGPWKGRKLYDLYKATEPPREWFPELLLHARKIGITIFSSVFSPEDVDFLEQFNPPAYAGERWPRLLPGRAAASVFTATTFVRRLKKPTSI